MATAKEYYDYVMECLGRELNVTSCKMMGEYCLYFEGTLFGGIYDNRFLVKQTETSRRMLAGCQLEIPYEGSKSKMFVVEEFEDSEFVKMLLNGMKKDLAKKN